MSNVQLSAPEKERNDFFSLQARFATSTLRILSHTNQVNYHNQTDALSEFCKTAPLSVLLDPNTTYTYPGIDTDKIRDEAKQVFGDFERHQSAVLSYAMGCGDKPDPVADLEKKAASFEAKYSELKR